MRKIFQTAHVSNILRNLNIKYKTFPQYLFYCHIKPYHNKYLLPMDKVYMRNETLSNELHITFRYANKDLGINRKFNFCRKMNEKIEDCLIRMRGNIEKELSRKSKKARKKKSSENVTENEEIKQLGEDSISFLCDHYKLANVTFSEMLAKREEHVLKLKILDDVLQININEPWIINFNLPATIMAGFMIYPRKLQMQFAELSCCTVQWFKGKMPASGKIQEVDLWKNIGNSFFLDVSNDEVGYFIKIMLIPADSVGNTGPGIERISEKAVQPGPGTCPFEIRHCFTKDRLQGSAYRVVSYNILADLYTDSDYSRSQLFPYCPRYALDIEYRKSLLLKEIIGYNSDIICLQEVDKKIFDMDLCVILQDPQYNYNGLFAQKGSSSEGVAIFYNTNRFDLIENYIINISEHTQRLPIFQEVWEKIKNNAELVKRISMRSTTLQMVLLKAKELEDKYLLVVNTHLYFHPDADHIRLLQMGFSMLYIEDMIQKFCNKYNISNEKHLALVFCGDFNSVPECGVYQLMTEGHVDEHSPDWRSKAEEAVSGLTLKQPFKMKSACGTPPYTNYTHLFAACLDYIFYQDDRLEVEQVVPLPSKEELTAYTAIPSVVFPSDHIALVADLKFKH